MLKEHLHTNQGFSIIEALLAGALFALVVTVFTGAIIYGEETAQLAGGMARATNVTEEGIEATRNIRDNAFSQLPTGNNGLAISGNQWIFSGAQDVVDIFTRKINVALNSLGSGSRSVSVSTTWTQTQQRGGSISISSYLTNWRGCRGGILVYGDGGATTDAVKYKTLKGNDASDCTWSSAASAADVDTSTTNKSLRAVQIYASSNRHEKIMLSRHYNGTTQYIYAQVYNGASSTWGNVQLLSSWSATTFLDIQNFSGTYLSNGDFMVVYSDNTTIPKARTWDGSSWQSQTSLTNLGTSQIPNVIVAHSRPGTNEVMAAFFTQGSGPNVGNTITEYWSGSAWSAITTHGVAAPPNTQKLIDFAWSPNDTTKGALVYTDNTNIKLIKMKVFTADGSGSGSWSLSASSQPVSSGIGTIAVVGRPGVNEFQACYENNATHDILCYKADFTPTFTDPTNLKININADTGIQRSFDVGFESVSGEPAIAVYSDQTSIPKLKKYTASTATWDIAATNLNALGGMLETVHIIPYPNTDEMMILLGDTNQAAYSLVWDGANNTTYATPSGYAFTAHGLSGSVDTDYWYDFAWDLY